MLCNNSNASSYDIKINFHNNNKYGLDITKYEEIEEEIDNCTEYKTEITKYPTLLCNDIKELAQNLTKASDGNFTSKSGDYKFDTNNNKIYTFNSVKYNGNEKINKISFISDANNNQTFPFVVMNFDSGHRCSSLKSIELANIQGIGFNFNTSYARHCHSPKINAMGWEHYPLNNPFRFSIDNISTNSDTKFMVNLPTHVKKSKLDCVSEQCNICYYDRFPTWYDTFNHSRMNCCFIARSGNNETEFDNSHHIMERINREFVDIKANVWNSCMMELGYDKSTVKDSLTDEYSEDNLDKSVDHLIQTMYPSIKAKRDKNHKTLMENKDEEYIKKYKQQKSQVLVNTCQKFHKLHKDINEAVCAITQKNREQIFDFETIFKFKEVK